ncbi:MAG: YlmC/YmxH family sporulation protein [Firmicutes bacterium]|nr:YlmC/YmxH family sporulation protein [Bacillota bacterium]
MRLSDIGNKDIIDLARGCHHGQLWDCELLFDPCNGKICALLIPETTGKKHRKYAPEQWKELPWSNIVKIREDMIIFKSDGFC